MKTNLTDTKTQVKSGYLGEGAEFEKHAFNENLGKKRPDGEGKNGAKVEN